MMPVRPILPWTTLKARFGLALSQVRLTYFPRVTPRGKVYIYAYLVAITYLFGRIPSDGLGPPDYGGTSSRYVAVEEDIVPPVDPGPPGLSEVGESLEVYWRFVVRFECHRLALVLTSNERPAKIRQIAHVIYGSEQCGK